MAEAIGQLAFTAIGLGAAAAFTVGATSITLGTIAGTAILVGGSIGLQMALAPSLPDVADTPVQRTPTGTGRLPPPEAGHQALRQSIAPRTVAYGRVRVAGTYVFFEAKDGRSYDIIALHHGQIGGFAGFYLHDDIVSNGQVATSGGYVFGLIDGRYADNHVFLNTRLGAVPEQTYGEVSTLLPEIWQFGVHRGDGLASLLMICEPTTDPSEFTRIFPRGKPEPSAVIDATPVRDIISGAITAAKPRGQNPVNQLIDYLTNDDYGMGLDYNTLIAPVAAELANEATLCEGIVLHPNGVGEYRYQSCGAFNIDSDPADVVAAILDTCDGWISENGDGTLALKVGVYRAPTVVLTSRHIRGINLQYDVADEEIVNELAVTYTEPMMDYKTAPADPWRNEEDIAERGRVRSQPFALPWVQSFSQARRLAKRRDAQNNAELRGTLTTTLYGLRALGERWIRIQAPELPDLGDIVIEVRGVTIDLLNSQLTFRFISINEEGIDAWSPNEEGEPTTIPAKLIDAAPPPIDPGTPGALNPRAYRTPGADAGGGDQYLGAVEFNDPHRSDITYQVQRRIAGSGAGFYLEPNVPPLGPPPTPAAFPTPQPDPSNIGINCLATDIHGTTGGNGALAGQNYEVQIRTVPPGGAGFASAWSSSMFIQT